MKQGFVSREEARNHCEFSRSRMRAVWWVSLLILGGAQLSCGEGVLADGGMKNAATNPADDDGGAETGDPSGDFADTRPDGDDGDSEAGEAADLPNDGDSDSGENTADAPSEGEAEGAGEGLSEAGIDPDPPFLPLPCDPIYDQGDMPTFEIQISEASWQGLQSDWKNWRENGAAALPLNPYRPLILFRYGDTVISDAMIRVRGSYLNWDRSPNKMQVDIAFNQVDKSHRFHGLRKIDLKSSWNDPTFLHDRLADTIFQDMGVPVSCSNHARLYVNGSYYGLFLNLEPVNEDFLARWYGPYDSGGNLYKWEDGPHGYEKKTNGKNPDVSDLTAFLEAKTYEEVMSAVDPQEMLLEWAAEGTMPQVDGYWAGGTNDYLYRHPVKGFQIIPWDLDTSFDYATVPDDPVAYAVDWGHGKSAAYQAVVDSAEGFARYLAALQQVMPAYDPDVLLARIDAWEAQILPALAEDANKPYNNDDHAWCLAQLKDFIRQRHDFMRQWLDAHSPASR